MPTILRLIFFFFSIYFANCCMYFSTAEAVLQEMDNINIRRNRRSGEVERLRMWTDTEFVSAVSHLLDKSTMKRGTCLFL